MEKDKTVLSAGSMSIGYPGRKAPIVIADGINLTLNAGKLISLIGANGIGKSTLLRTLTGIQKPAAGDILLNGKNITEYNTKELAQCLSVVLTENLPPSNLSVYELVALGRQPYTNWLGTMAPADVEKVMNAISLTEIGHLASKKHYEISDGQLQKVLIARALAQDTPLIVLDEPTTHLDLLHKVSLLRLLKRLTGETGKCVLYSTHDIDLALQLSDEMIVMAQGMVVQDAPRNLIENNVLDTIFNDPGITFDPDKGSYIFTSG